MGKRITISRYRKNPDFYIVSGYKRFKPLLLFNKQNAIEVAKSRRRLIKKGRA